MSPMRPFIVINLFMLLTCAFSQTYLRQPGFVSKLNPAGVAACSTSDSTLAHDEFREGFTSLATDNTWVSGGGEAGITLTTNADISSLTTGKAAGQCDYAFKADIVSSGGTETYIRWDRGSGIATNVDIYTAFYLWVDTAPDSGEGFTFAYFGANSNPTTGGRRHFLTLNNTAGQLKLTASGQTSTSTTGSNGNISTGTWNLVEVSSGVGEGNPSTLTINGGSALNFASANQLMRYVSIGSVVSLEAGDSAVFYIDLVCVNTP